MERDPRQGRQRQRVEEKEVERRLTVIPSEEREGLAPKFEVERSVDAEESGLRVDHTEEVPSGASVSVEGVSAEKFENGQAICLAAGRSITNLKNAGTVLAWLFVQAVERRREGPWLWIFRVLYESVQAATGSGGPSKAASFPMRRGETEEVVEALKRVGLTHASSTVFS